MDFSMLAVNSNRSKAYLQNMVKYSFIPRRVIVLSNENLDNIYKEITDNKLYNNNDNSLRKFDGVDLCFDEKEHIIKTLEDNRIDYMIIKTLDTNSPNVVDAIKNIRENTIIYSGAGGTIVSQEILSLGKELIHVHSGWLPEYRGSTTMYYSLLIDSNICCSVIALDEKIDTGDLLFRKKYDIPNDIFHYDYVVDPILRADSLMEYLECERKNMIQRSKQIEKGNTFYIIHPVLKNLAILNHSRYKVHAGFYS